MGKLNFTEVDKNSAAYKSSNSILESFVATGATPPDGSTFKIVDAGMVEDINLGLDPQPVFVTDKGNRLFIKSLIRDTITTDPVTHQLETKTPNGEFNRLLREKLSSLKTQTNGATLDALIKWAKSLTLRMRKEMVLKVTYSGEVRPSAIHHIDIVK